MKIRYMLLLGGSFTPFVFAYAARGPRINSGLSMIGYMRKFNIFGGRVSISFTFYFEDDTIFLRWEI